MADGSADTERAVRYLHEATQGAEGEDGKKEFSCRWFLDRSFYCVSTYPSLVLSGKSVGVLACLLVAHFACHGTVQLLETR